MAATRLEIYNGALTLCSDRRLSHLTENREPRYLLDEVWAGGRGVRACLEGAQWHFAMRSARFDYDVAHTPEFGLRYAFVKPSDWVLTSGVFQDAYMQAPLLQYADETGFWFADQQEIFVRYVSDHANYGGDFSKWPETFTEYVKAYFASRIIRKLPGGAEKVESICDPKKGACALALSAAKNRSVMTGPATFPNRGSWVAARHRGMNPRRDGGNTSSLIG